jgi:SAM-dependent methyltransferase
MTSPASDRPLFEDPAAYDHFMGRYSRPLSQELIRASGVRPGDRVLDVGCGPGALATALAAVVGAGRICAVEPSEPFAVAARERVPGADVRAIPAESLPWADGEFDCALSQLVFQFVSDPAAAASEMARVTRPGGTVTACVWDATGGMTMFRSYWDAVVAAGAGTRDDRERFGGSPGQLAELWGRVGLRDVESGALEVEAPYRDVDELWDSFLGGAGPIGVHATALDDDAQAAVREALHRAVGSPDGPFSLPARAWYAKGVV